MKSISFKAIGKLIEKYDSIVIYRHTNPDYDAFGSQLGLKYLIKDNYPDKTVYTYGDEIDKVIDNPEYLENMDFNKDNVDLNIVKNSLTILVDTSTDDRADDKGAPYRESACSLKIDHHEDSVKTPDYGYLAPKASSTCFIIANIAFKNKWKIGKKAAEYLYGGMNTDTLGFTVSSVDKETFDTVGKLLDFCKELNIAQVCRYVNDVRKDVYDAETYYRMKAIIKGDVAYFYSTVDERNKFDITEGEAKHFVDCLSRIKSVEKYACFIEKEKKNEDDTTSFSVSLRSHSKPIRQIALNYGNPHGGGHELSSGIGSVSLDETKSIIKDLLELK